MRHLLPHIALLALGLAERPRRRARDDVPRIGGPSWGFTIPRIQNEIPGSPIRNELRQRRRANAARNFTTGHWQHHIHDAKRV